MKITIEVTLDKKAGKTCDVEEVFAELETEWDGAMVYPQSANADEESDYEVTALRLVREPAQP